MTYLDRYEKLNERLNLELIMFLLESSQEEYTVQYKVNDGDTKIVKRNIDGITLNSKGSISIVGSSSYYDNCDGEEVTINNFFRTSVSSFIKISEELTNDIEQFKKDIDESLCNTFVNIYNSNKYRKSKTERKNLIEYVFCPEVNFGEKGVQAKITKNAKNQYLIQFFDVNDEFLVSYEFNQELLSTKMLLLKYLENQMKTL